MTRWHVMRIYAGAEFAVCSAMTAAGYVAYCPAYIERRRKGGFYSKDRQEIALPLFPGYAFVQHDSTFRKEAFETARIKISVFRTSYLRDDQMDAIRDTANEASKVTTERKIVPGQFAKLLHGVLKGESAKVLRIKGHRALLEFTRGGRRAEMTVMVRDLEAVG
jgi:transcription antitermination factor NusG